MMMRSKYTAKDCEILFDQTVERTDLLRKGVILYRTQRVVCGDFIYASVYPIWDTRAQLIEARRIAKAKESSPIQKRLNLRHSQLRLEQMANTNFGAGDIFLTLTYASDTQPSDDAQAQKDIQAYFKRLRAYRRKLNLSELKYLYVTEQTSTGRYHHHIIMSGDGVSRDDIERLWKGGLANTRRVQQQDSNLAGLAHYMRMPKDKQIKTNRRKWNGSRNLKKPRITTADHKISIRKVTRIARDIQDDGIKIFETAFPGHRIVGDIVIRYSDYVAGAYIYVKMRKHKGGIIDYKDVMP